MEALRAAAEAMNGNKVVWAVASVVFNMGSRALMADIVPSHDRVLQHALVKRLVVFSMFFVVTRDALLCVALTAAFEAVFYGLMHEGSRFCVVPRVRLGPGAATGAATGAPASRGLLRWARRAWRAAFDGVDGADKRELYADADADHADDAGGPPTPPPEPADAGDVAGAGRPMAWTPASPPPRVAT